MSPSLNEEKRTVLKKVDITKEKLVRKQIPVVRNVLEPPNLAHPRKESSTFPEQFPGCRVTESGVENVAQRRFRMISSRLLN
jgi:hypothetical protein